MDQLDRELIRILQKDARMAYTKMAKELGQPDTTIHFRTRKLKESGIVTRFSALVAPSSLGYNVAALLKVEIGGHILPDISKDRTVTFAQELAKDESYLWVAVGNEPMTLYALTMGGDDAAIEERVNRLRKSPDVAKVTATVLSSVVKGWEVSGNPPARDEQR